MLDLKAIGKQVRRFSSLEFPPTEPEGWNELAKVLQRRCQTMDHIERVVDRWLETEDRSPTPARLAAHAGNVAADKELDNPVLAEACPECAPYAGIWRSVERLKKNGETMQGLARCTCSRGRQLAALDAIRVQSEAAKPRRATTGLSQIRDQEAS